MKSLLKRLGEAFVIRFTFTRLLVMPPRASFPYPTQFQVSFRIRRLRRPVAYLPSGTLASERNLAIHKQYQAGFTLFQLAEMFHLSYQRVHQIIRREQRSKDQ